MNGKYDQCNVFQMPAFTACAAMHQEGRNCARRFVAAFAAMSEIALNRYSGRLPPTRHLWQQWVQGVKTKSVSLDEEKDSLARQLERIAMKASS